MCGIAGIYNIDGAPVSDVLLSGMTKIIDYRGPDDEGFVLINTATGEAKPCSGNDSTEQIRLKYDKLANTFGASLGLGFRRLSILDLSEKGHQPMSDRGGNVWIVFNGEIYNYIEIRSELEKKGYVFISGADTEVIINAWLEWGENCLQRFNGMWSFALYDVRNKTLFCARDRFGVKPFNYHYDGKKLVFGSEVKQVLLHLDQYSPNEKSLVRFLHFNGNIGYGDETMFSQVKTLPPAHFLKIDCNGMHLSKYYDLDSDRFETYKGSFDQAREEYLSIFRDAVRLRMRSDVEVGSCLSGGLDSSAIVCEAAGLTDSTFKTFNAYYENPPQMDERKWVDLVCQRTNCTPYFISPTPEMVERDLGKMIFHQDIPLSTSSPCSQYYIMQLASNNNIRVLLDGQGSDEITAGYKHAFYRYYGDLLRYFRLGSFISQFPAYIKASGSPAATTAKIISTILFSDRYVNYLEICKNNRRLPVNIDFDKDIISNFSRMKTSGLSTFSYNILTKGYLQTLLHFEDRNSMSASVESRVPFLDYRLVEFSFSLPSSFKIHKNYGKYVHRKAIEQIVPAEIAARKDKIPFLAPGESLWLQNDLKEYARSMIFSESASRREYFDVAEIRKIFTHYLAHPSASAGQLIWKIISLENWFRVFFDQKDFKKTNIR